MIRPEEVVKIGAFLKTHGLQGEIVMTSGLDVPELNLLKCIVVEIDGLLVPFFIENLRLRGSSSYLIKFQGIDNIDDTDIIIGKDACALKLDLAENNIMDDDDNIYLDNLIGYEVSDLSVGSLGIFKDYDDSTQNIVAIVNNGDSGQILIPFVEEFVDSIDVKSKKIVMDLPHGLVDIN